MTYIGGALTLLHRVPKIKIQDNLVSTSGMKLLEVLPLHPRKDVSLSKGYTQ